VAITGQWADGSPMLAIPNYARMNRVGPPHEYPSDEETVPTDRRNDSGKVMSKVWI
jgi:hypothetical protein